MTSFTGPQTIMLATEHLSHLYILIGRLDVLLCHHPDTFKDNIVGVLRRG